MTVSLDDVRQVVALQLGLKTVAASDRIVEELGAESVDIVNIVAALEDRYRITIAEEQIPDVETVAHLHELVSRLAD